MCNHLVFRYYPITCHFRKIKTLGSTEPVGIVGGELFGSVTVKFRFQTRVSLNQISCNKIHFIKKDTAVGYNQDNKILTQLIGIGVFWNIKEKQLKSKATPSGKVVCFMLYGIARQHKIFILDQSNKLIHLFNLIQNQIGN